MARAHLASFTDAGTEIKCTLQDSLVIASRLDDLSNGAACRLALYGSLVRRVDASPASLRVYKVKRKEGCIDRILPDGCTAVCRGFFKKETDLSVFVGLKAWLCSVQRFHAEHEAEGRRAFNVSEHMHM